MGKNWKGHGGGKGGGHGNDFSSCRGHGVVIGTCDAARERETSKELVNLLTQTIETLYPQSSNGQASDSEEEEGEVRVESIQDMLKNEINEIRNQKNKETQAVMSVNTGVKGIVLIKIVRKDICPVALVKSVFDQVKREKLPLTRFVVRVIPLKLCCFPNEEELNESLKLIVDKSITLNEAGKCVVDEHVPTNAFKLTNKQKWVPPPSEKTVAEEGSSADAAEGKEDPQNEDEHLSKKAKTEESVPEAPVAAVEPATVTAVPIQLMYTISFKARNHNTLNKDMLFKAAIRQMPKYARNDYRRPELMVMVEAIKNLCAITIIKGYEQYMEFNLRKFQTVHCGDGNSGGNNNNNTSSGSDANASAKVAEAVVESSTKTEDDVESDAE